MFGGPMISAEETKRMLAQGMMPGAKPAPTPPAAAAAAGAGGVDGAAAAAPGPFGAPPPAADPDQRRGRGPSPRQLAYFQRSAALTLLDLRTHEAAEEEGGPPPRGTRRTRADAPGDALPAGAPVCVRAPKGGLAARFVNKAHGWLCEALGKRGVTVLAFEDAGHVCARLLSGGRDGAPLTEGAAAEIAATLEAELQGMGERDEIEWAALSEATAVACKQLLLSLHVSVEEPEEGEWEQGVRPNFDREKIAAIQLEGVAASGEEGAELREMGFSVGGSRLMYQQPQLWGDGHWKLWEERSPFGAPRRLLDQAYALATWMPHQVLHCVQGAAVGAEGTASWPPLSRWQCEYCVTHGQALLMEAVIAEQRKMGAARRTLPLPSHIVEESLLWLEACVRLRGGEEAQRWAREWAGSNAQRSPVPGGCPEPSVYMREHPAEYGALLGSNVVAACERWQSLVERDEQVTSYWAELIKYLNRMLRATSSAAAAGVAAGLRVPTTPAP